VFSTIKSRNEINNYILSSDYWANYIAIDAIISVLGLNIIAVEKTLDNKIRVPYINTRYNWNKYMFLYYQNAHYELISFDYILQKIQKQPKLTVKKITKTITIFDKNSSLNPPFWLLFLIFSTVYINFKEDVDRQNFKLLPYIFNSLFLTYNNILKLPDNNNKTAFIDLFNKYFYPSNLLSKANTQPNVMSITYGGAPISMSNPTPNYIQPNRFMPYNRNNQRLTLNRGINDDPVSNISYYITIDIVLKKGTSLSTSDMINLKCDQQYNKIRKNYAELRGLKYTIPPVYDNLPSFKQNQVERQSQRQNITKKVGGYNISKKITRKRI
jgi:hypothetical protein